MSTQAMTYLTDAVLITAVVPTGRADTMLAAARAVGATGGIVHGAHGTGVRERLGLLAIAVEAEKEILSIVVAAEHQELVTRAIFNAGELGRPGGGFLYVSPLEKVATYIPAAVMARMEGRG